MNKKENKRRERKIKQEHHIYIYIHKDSRYKKYAIIEQIQINKHKKKKKTYITNH